MNKKIVVVISELRKPFLKSVLQTAACGILLFYWTFAVMPVLACGLGNVDESKGIFNCVSGDMTVSSTLVLLAGIFVASLLLGRSAELIQRRVQAK